MLAGMAVSNYGDGSGNSGMAPLRSSGGPSPSKGAFPDLDSQLRAGIDLVQDAFTRNTAALKHEITHWKHVAMQHKEQSSTLDAQVGTLSRRISELERMLIAQTSEKKALIASKNALLDRYNALKKSASQLESFRKSIVSMVEFSPAAQPQLLALDAESYLGTSSKPDPQTNGIDEERAPNLNSCTNAAAPAATSAALDHAKSLKDSGISSNGSSGFPSSSSGNAGTRQTLQDGLDSMGGSAKPHPIDIETDAAHSTSYLDPNNRSITDIVRTAP
eukprot:jgi/Hompol1/3513/HPOL_006579-RA